MMDQMKSVAFSLVAGFILTMVDRLLVADFLRPFLDANLVTILLALLAINITTSSVVMTKLRELHEIKGLDFPNATRELRKSLVEQVVLIACAVVFLILGSSEVLRSVIGDWIVITTTVLTAILVSSLQNLYDTGKAVFVIYQFEGKEKR